ncbi:MAG: [FeFe] hydrogenase H-cluster maturation GTPase HydF [Prolixibacteraceae bacterium]|nr:[FeFe] hydrogenase H-cluster maturation GTPase HydF [Prolixibacteraceae bacterium]
MKGKDNKPHIGIFGRRNNGKSSFINMICGQEVAIVSNFAGTTTDPVKKSVEIFGIGPTIIIDTAGIDDKGELGKKRIDKTLKVIKTIDLAILLISDNKFGEFENMLIDEFNKYDVPFVLFHNKKDKAVADKALKSALAEKYNKTLLDISTMDNSDLEKVTQMIRENIPESVFKKPSLLEGLVKPKDMVLLITPIDSEAPEGRMILPQVMAIRDVLDQHCICVCVRETELEDFMKLDIKPALAVTDSQAFEYVSSIVPADVPLTGFSILFARLKANFNKYLEGTPYISKLKDGDKILMLESCTHHLSCEDIGRYKLPRWIKEFTAKDIEFEVVAGLDDFQKEIYNYAMVIQCGGCVATKKQITSRLKPAIDAGIPVSNYGMAIAWLNGIFKRAVEPFH